jgi:hypothetical protein
MARTCRGLVSRVKLIVEVELPELMCSGQKIARETILKWGRSLHCAERKEATQVPAVALPRTHVTSWPEGEAAGQVQPGLKHAKMDLDD